MEILSENRKKEYPKSVTQLLRLGKKVKKKGKAIPVPGHGGP
jgi:hypothetical protein